MLLTPATTGPSGSGAVSVDTRSGADAQSIAGVRPVGSGVGGTAWCSRHSTVLIRPTMPAAASECPTLALADPTRQRGAFTARGPRTWDSAVSSVRSPTGVPVPCASTYATSRGSTPAWA